MTVSIWKMTVSIWKMTASIWKMTESIWDILSLCLPALSENAAIMAPLSFAFGRHSRFDASTHVACPVARATYRCTR